MMGKPYIMFSYAVCIAFMSGPGGVLLGLIIKPESNQLMISLNHQQAYKLSPIETHSQTS